MKSLTLFTVLLCFSTFAYSQTTTYTGTIQAPNADGMYLDSWFNLKPKTGATATNNWNIVHTDNNSIFSVWYGAAAPYVKVGEAKVTKLFVNGATEINASSTSTASLKVRHLNETDPTWGMTFEQKSDLTGRIACAGYDLQIESGWNRKLILGNVAYDANNGRVLIPGGKLGIGAEPDEKLTVKGKVHAQEIKVDLLGNIAPDYVFEKSYKLPDLKSVKNYIDENKHLPEVPSAREMETNGVQLLEMNLLLLKKVEELTLYVIDLKSENEILKEKVATIESKVK